jgi:Na+-transporting methylmalonyl-CoA/oxaloacetate decarboxylase gamma subunit
VYLVGINDETLREVGNVLFVLLLFATVMGGMGQMVDAALYS